MRRREKRFRGLIFVLFLIFSLWAVLQFLAPFALPKDSVSDLSGVVGVLDNTKTIQNMSFPWNMIYSSGDRLCHQQATRSLFLNGNQMPYCTRCTAIWLGIAIGLVFITFFVLELSGIFVASFLLGLIPIGIDGIGQLLGFWESTNLIRFLTGLPAGIICGVAIGIIIDESKGLLSDLRRKKKE
jgi:uncharacterized membrane protein